MKRFYQETPFECAYCSHYFVSPRTFTMTLSGGDQFGICEKCRLDVTCDRCGSHMRPEEIYIEECHICDKIYIACKNCCTAPETFSQKVKDRGLRMLHSLRVCGLSVRSRIINCCFTSGEKPLRISAVFHLKKEAQEGSDREQREF